MTVAMRRLPSSGITGGVEEAGSNGAGGWSGAATSTNAVPHIPQKRNSGGFNVPHTGQVCARRVPHIPQNLMPGGLSNPQEVHFITLIISNISPSSCDYSFLKILKSPAFVYRSN
jgi:hypothetical protein